MIALMASWLCGAVPAAAAEPPAEQRRVFEDYGNVTEGSVDAAGAVWLKLWEPYVRYRIPPQSDEKSKALLFLLEQANEGRRALFVLYDGAEGRLNPATGTLDYPLCSLALDQLKFEPSQACSNAPVAAPANAEAALARARAHSTAGNSDLAQKLLGAAPLPAAAPAKKLFLTVRAQNDTLVADTRPRGSRGADEALVASLTDYRALAALDPKDVEHQFDIAGALLDLGAYAEARAVYDAILARWPDEAYRISVRIGALHRAQGQYDKALQSLNDLIARSGPQEGMKFHYHRGWTLSLLGRYDEAIREFGEGLKGQPDYSAAYLLRGCAYAGIGRLKDALADFEESARLLALLPGAGRVKWLREDQDEAELLRQRVRAALAAGDGTPLAGRCPSPKWDRYERPRARSPLLPPS
ncbi:MAG TPA: tetratricopeptide repeat protein [Allosphingosinicella sp.]